MAYDESLRVQVDRLIEIKRMAEQLRQEQGELEAVLLLRGQADLRDTKFKSVTYGGISGKATVTMAESLKLTYPSILKSALGPAYDDAVAVETKYRVSAPAARMLTGIWLGNYTRMTVAEVVEQLPAGEGIKKLLHKKLRGANYASDKQNLMMVGGFPEKEAEGYAYFVAEAAVWETFSKLMRAAGKETGKQVSEALDQISGAVIVEETPKITLEQFV